MTNSKPEIGFIGLGIMGGPMARNLQRAGYSLHICDRDPSRLEDLAANGARINLSGESVAQNADIIILMVPDTPHVQAALFGEEGVASGLSAGQLVIDMSSISPKATTEFAARINQLECDYLDAPVSGGAAKAITGELSIMVGGPRPAFERAMPLFEVMGGTVTLIGERNGDGQVCKVANQILVGTMVSGVAEALLFASKAGADAARVRDALMGGAVKSIILENHGQRMLDRNFEASFRAELQRKDLGLAVEACKDLGLYLPGATASWQLFNACIAGGDGSEDHIAVLKTLEKMAGFELGDPA
jgi:2-hydroxy-3-oxopropionate reductase